MRRRGRPHKESVTILFSTAGILAACGLAGLAIAATNGVDDATSAASLLLWIFGGLAVLGAAYICMHFFFPALPLYQPRQRLTASASAMPSVALLIGYPYWLNPYTGRKAAANALLVEAQNLLRWLPHAPTDALVAALAGIELNRGTKAVARWEERVGIFISARASECSALFSSSAGIPPEGPLLRTYLEERIAELKTIHAQL